MSDPVSSLTAHLTTCHPVVFLGRAAGGVNHPDRVSTRPLFQSFATAHPEWVPHDRAKRAGQRNPMFAAFRDVWLPQALARLGGTEDVRYCRKRKYELDTGEHGPRRVDGWQMHTPSNAKYAPARLGVAVYYDAELEFASIKDGMCPARSE